MVSNQSFHQSLEFFVSCPPKSKKAKPQTKKQVRKKKKKGKEKNITKELQAEDDNN
jgi:hypothetical protein